MVEPHLSESHPSLPPSDRNMSRFQWLLAEARFHLLPWGQGFIHQKTTIVAASIALAVVVTVIWMMAATGYVSSAVVIAWWTGWSIYECICRLRCKPWIKEGRWWGRAYRRASLPDMIAYVATKNLLLGAGLFLVLYFLGALPDTA